MKAHLRTTIETLLQAGASHQQIQRHTGVDRKTIRRYARAANSPTPATGSEGPVDQTPPLRPPAADRATLSACDAYRIWIEAQVQLGRNAVSIHQDLVDQDAFQHGYNSVKRFVAKLRAREPERFDVLEFLLGEDYGEHPDMLSQA